MIAIYIANRLQNKSEIL